MQPIIPRAIRSFAVTSLLAAAFATGAVPSGASSVLTPPPWVPAPVLAPGPAISPASPTAAAVKLVAVASGLSSPLLALGPNDGTGRLFIVEKTGRIRIVKGGILLSAPFLDLSKSVSTGSEQGLLGLAFSPAFKTNHRFYVDYTDVNGNTVIREYRASTTAPNRVLGGSGRTILRIHQPYANHNGGMLAFGPDGYLYIGMGDGGSGGDPGNRAQSTSTLLGKMLRIDINGTSSGKQYRIPASNPYVGRAGLDEIWQIGLRNPWRFSFDRATGALWIGDVGQNRYEEVDKAVKTATGPGRGFNWGWHKREGFACYTPATGCQSAGLQRPVLAYSHATNGRCAITGGYVYRGSAIPVLQGWYIFGDYCSGEVLAVSAASGSGSRPTPITLFGTSSGRMVSSFGQDAAGELYVCDLNGTVYKIVRA